LVDVRLFSGPVVELIFHNIGSNGNTGTTPVFEIDADDLATISNANLEPAIVAIDQFFNDLVATFPSASSNGTGNSTDGSTAPSTASSTKLSKEFFVV